MLVLTRKPGQSVTIDRKGMKVYKVSIQKRDNIKNIIKEPAEQDESARDGTFSTEGSL